LSFFTDILTVSGSHSFIYNQATLHYSKYGSGAHFILAFHGFGQTHSVFKELEQEDCTMYSFDLFFHGESKWDYGEAPLEKSFWKELMTAFLKQEAIEKFGVIGFSIGGKFALACVEAFPNQLDSIMLLAPDGVKTSFWYSLATYPLMLRNLFKSMIDKPGRFHSLTKIAFNFKLIDKGILRFVESQMNSHEKRERVYHSWVVLRHLKFDISDIAVIVNTHKIPLILVIGKHDKIITAKNMTSLISRVPHAKLQLIESGHNTVISVWARVKNEC
jgi:pimeloyl-ACP methyl ester carboxylesterase